VGRREAVYLVIRQTELSKNLNDPRPRKKGDRGIAQALEDGS
jgi:hypothetical protein